MCGVACGLLGLMVAVCGADPSVQTRRSNDMARQKVASPLTAVDPVLEVSIARGHSRVLRAKTGIRRTAVDNPVVSDVVQVSAQDLLIVGRSTGTTGLSVWIGETSPPVTILVHVTSKP